MALQNFEQPLENGDPLRAQRMTPAESRAVIDLWQQERVEETGLTDKPAVPDVAEGLDISVEEVQRLLQEVRAKRRDEECALATERELSKIRLAEEEQKLAEVRRQRAELQRGLASCPMIEHLPRQQQSITQSEWVEVRPGIWEDARVPSYSYIDFDLLAPNKDDSSQRVRPQSARFAVALAKVIWFVALGLTLTPIAYLIYLTASQLPH